MNFTSLRITCNRGIKDGLRGVNPTKEDLIGSEHAIMYFVAHLVVASVNAIQVPLGALNILQSIKNI